MTAGPHLNQPGGPFRASRHPAIAGRERELRNLADGLRRVVEALVRTEVPVETLVDAERRLSRVVAALEAGAPDRPMPQFTPAPPAGQPRRTHDGSPFDVVHGLYSPLAPPLRMEIDGDRAIADVAFGYAYEGPPGCVHGAVLVGCFDMVLAALPAQQQIGGPTARLGARYRRPTLLHVPTRFEALLTERHRRRVVCEGRAIQNGEVTVEASATFVPLSREQLARMVDP